MVSFENDYSAGAHPKVMQRLLETNLVKVTGYGLDEYCESARAKIRQAVGCPEAEVEFLVGGTQTNATVIASMLHDWEGVVAAGTGHVSVHEAGAIEYNAHKVLTVEPKDGKVDANVLDRYIKDFYNDGNHEHMVFPGMVYISHPTEFGTLYSLKELTEVSEVCHKYQIPLYLDGARLAYGLMSKETDVTLQDIARLCDVFYIGGTKCGTLVGEAVVFTKNNRPAHFMNSVKKRGALLAKGRVLGVQFDALFTDNLYYELGKHAIDKAEELKEVLHEKGLEFFLESPTNQQYIIMENSKLDALKEKVVYSFWDKYDDTHTVIRFVTSWATTEEDIEELRKAL